MAPIWTLGLKVVNEMREGAATVLPSDRLQDFQFHLMSMTGLQYFNGIISWLFFSTGVRGEREASEDNNSCRRTADQRRAR